MAKVTINDTSLTAIGNAIRNKTGKSELLLPSEMPEEIESISGGYTPPSIELMPVNKGLHWYYDETTLDYSKKQWHNAIEPKYFLDYSGFEMSPDADGSIFFSGYTGNEAEVYSTAKQHQFHCYNHFTFYLIVKRKPLSEGGALLGDFGRIYMYGDNVNHHWMFDGLSSQDDIRNYNVITLVGEENGSTYPSCKIKYTLYINGVKSGERTHSFITWDFLTWFAYGTSYQSYVKLMVFGNQIHSAEEILQNVNWLKGKYNLNKNR